jgi:hypothetical protein
MASAINFHHLVSWLNSANFAHSICQSFDVIHTWLQGFRVWSQPNNVPTTRRSHASRVIFT